MCFSGNARGDLPIARYIAGLPASCLVYDYDHNAPDAAFLKETHKPFLDTILSKNPSLSVLVLSRPNDLGFYRMAKNVSEKIQALLACSEP